MRGQHIHLRELEANDWRAVNAYAGDEEVVAYQAWGPHSEQDSQVWVNYLIEERKKQPRKNFYWGICSNLDGELIGGLGVHQPFPPEHPFSAEIGYSLRRTHWKRGLGTEALTLAISHVFTQTEIVRLVGICRVENVASARLLEKLGFRREGHHLNDVLIRGKTMSSYTYALLKSEYDRNR